MRKTAVICLLMFFGSAFAFNHPEIIWRTVSTPHFLIHYSDQTEPALYATYKIAEEAYAALAAVYRFPVGPKINISIIDYDDESNGGAMWLSRNIVISLQDNIFDLRGNTVWLRDVITHELAHIMTLDKTSSIFDVNLGFSYTAPGCFIGIFEPLPLITPLPDWVAEGLAQYGAQSQGSDCWDTRREMVQRCAITEHRELTLDEMGSLSHSSQQNEQVYNQGYSLIRHCVARAQKDNLFAAAISKSRGGSLIPPSFESLCRDFEKISMDQMYRGWRDSLRTLYTSATVAATTPVVPLWEGGLHNTRPRYSADREMVGWLTSEKGDYSRTDLVIIDTHTKEMIARIPYARQTWDFAPDGKGVYYVRLYCSNKYGSFLNELFYYNFSTKKSVQRTNNGRIYDCVSAAQDSVLWCVRYGEGVFGIEKYNCATGLFTPVIAGAVGSPFVSLSPCSFDSTLLVASRIVNGVSKLYLVDVVLKRVTGLDSAPGNEESPYWAADSAIYFSGDKNGYFNIYSMRLHEEPGVPQPEISGDTAIGRSDSLAPAASIERVWRATIARHTTTNRGLFTPFHKRGDTLICSEYTASGFRIVKLCKDSAVVVDTAVAPMASCQYLALPRPAGKVTVNSTLYSSGFLSSTSEFAGGVDLFAHGVQTYYVLSAMGSSYAADALSKQMFGVAGGMQIADTRLILSNSHTTASSLPVASDGIFDRRHGRNFVSENRSKSAIVQDLIAMRNTSSDRTSRQMIAASAAAGSSDSSAGGYPPWISIVNGQAMYENHMFAQTYGALAKIAFIPAALYVQADLSVTKQDDLGENIDMGIQPSFSFGSAPPSAQIDIYGNILSYGHGSMYGSYTGRNQSGISWSTGLATIPFANIGLFDTTLEYAARASAGIGAGHGFPIGAYSSITTKILGNIDFYDKKFPAPDTAFLQNDFNYGSIGAFCAYNFPIVRTINRGRDRYADALFGSIGCNNEIMFGWSGVSARDTVAFVNAFTVTASLSMNLVKSYLFTQRLTASCEYHPAKKAVGFLLILQ